MNPGKPTQPQTWEKPKGYPGHLWIMGKQCIIWLEPRPPYCDRGRYVAKLFEIWGELALPGGVDWSDGWPRYYFDLERAKAEVEAWLRARGQW